MRRATLMDNDINDINGKRNVRDMIPIPRTTSMGEIRKQAPICY
jgi:hypothetical protein